MSSETRELLAILVGLAPWIIFAGAVTWSLAHEFRDQLRASHSRRNHVRQRQEPKDAASHRSTAGGRFSSSRPGARR